MCYFNSAHVETEGCSCGQNNAAASTSTRVTPLPLLSGDGKMPKNDEVADERVYGLRIRFRIPTNRYGPENNVKRLSKYTSPNER